jgi:hypothetical protein
MTIASLRCHFEKSRVEQALQENFLRVAKRHCHYPNEHGLTTDESAAVTSTPWIGVNRVSIVF